MSPLKGILTLVFCFVVTIQADAAPRSSSRLDQILTRAVTAANEGDYRTALRLYQRLERSNRPWYIWAGTSGQIAVHRMAGDGESARAITEQIATHRPELAGLMAIWDGDTAFLEGDGEGAVAAYLKAVELHGDEWVDGKPIGATALEQMSRAYLELGDPSAAVVAQRELLRRYPRFVDNDLTTAKIMAFEAMEAGDLPIKPLERLVEDGDCSSQRPCVLTEGQMIEEIPPDAVRIRGMRGIYILRDRRSTPEIYDMTEETAATDVVSQATACTTLDATDGFQLPISNNSHYGYRFMTYPDCCSGWHPGVDLNGPGDDCDQDFYSVARGCVRDVMSSNTDWGTAAVEHRYEPGLWTSQYGHGDRVYYSVAQAIGKGAALGNIDTIGKSTGCHLHFEIREEDHTARNSASTYHNSPQSTVGDEYQDPETFIAAHRAYEEVRWVDEESFSFTGSWNDVTGVGDGDDLKWAYTTSTYSNYARYEWTPGVTGVNEVWAFVPWNHATSTKARIKVVNRSTGSTVMESELNQSIRYDAWVRIGSAVFYSGTTYRLEVATNTSESNKKVAVDDFLIIRTDDQGGDCVDDVASNRWKGEYFNNRDSSGSPVMVRDDGNGDLNFDWGTGSPGSSCGVPSDNFSVRWTRTVNFGAGTYRFTITSDDGFRLYVDNVLKIEKWFDQGPTTYTVDVAFSAGNHTLRLDYYEHGGGAVARLSWEAISTCTVSVPSTQWKGEYFSNRTLGGTPTMVRNDGSGFLNFEWYSDNPSPECGMPADDFSVRWTRTAYFNAGTYRFTVTSDDGFRLYVDNALKIEKWFDQGPTTYTIDVPLSAGNHNLKMEYYEHGGWAVAELSWQVLSSCNAGVPSDRWKGEYFNNRDLSGTLSMVRDDGNGNLNFDWGGGSPSSSCGIAADNFSVRWTRTVNFSAGTYRFTIVSDDGFRLYVDGSLKLAKWFDQAPTTYTVDVPLSAGNHTLRLDYYENGGGAVAKLSWQVLSSCNAGVPSDRWKGEYFNNRDLSGSPAMVRDDGNGSLNFDWGGGSPSSSCGIAADNFSVRWTRTVNLSAGTYRFTIVSDDGFRLYVDGSLKLAKWFDQGPTTYTVDVPLSAGNHTLRLDYYENGGGAVAKLSWQGAASGTVVVDDREAGFSRFGPSQYWWEASIGYSSHMYWTYVNGSVKSNYARWTPNLSFLGSGSYKVYVFIPRDNATSQQATYLIRHNGQSHYSASVNQSLYFDQWIYIGTYDFSASGGEYVELSDATGEAGSTGRKIGFDAVKFVK